MIKDIQQSQGLIQDRLDTSTERLVRREKEGRREEERVCVCVCVCVCARAMVHQCHWGTAAAPTISGSRADCVPSSHLHVQ